MAQATSKPLGYWGWSRALPRVWPGKIQAGVEAVLYFTEVLGLSERACATPRNLLKQKARLHKGKEA